MYGANLAYMHRTTVYLDEQVCADLARIAEDTGRSQAELIREALAEYTHRARVKAPRSIGAGASGRGDLSARFDELLFRPKGRGSSRGARS